MTTVYKALIFLYTNAYNYATLANMCKISYV